MTLVHDLSNRYNVCHEEIDSLVQKEKLAALQPLVRQLLYLPVDNYSMSNLLEVLNKNITDELHSKASPQILYDLYDSDNSEENLKAIIERARHELEGMRMILNSASSILDTDSSAKVLEESIL